MLKLQPQPPRLDPGFQSIGRLWGAAGQSLDRPCNRFCIGIRVELEATRNERINRLRTLHALQGVVWQVQQRSLGGGPKITEAWVVQALSTSDERVPSHEGLCVPSPVCIRIPHVSEFYSYYCAVPDFCSSQVASSSSI